MLKEEQIEASTDQLIEDYKKLDDRCETLIKIRKKKKKEKHGEQQ